MIELMQDAIKVSSSLYIPILKSAFINKRDFKLVTPLPPSFPPPKTLTTQNSYKPRPNPHLEKRKKT
jgi:hypothetical protein